MLNCILRFYTLLFINGNVMQDIIELNITKLFIIKTLELDLMVFIWGVEHKS